MQENLLIPKTIHVGFQNRKDTYTGKLAYIIYTDAKGKRRKEASWESWRDGTIEPIDYVNKPTDGFVLDKKVGDYGGWNPRKAWVRVYDPRDFEFEISVANLLFILQECSAIKGKGLEGEFVYSWDGKELVLLPTSSKEYKTSTEYSSLQNKKVTKKDMVEGCIYVNKDNEQYMYLGRHDWYELRRTYYNYDYIYAIETSKKHIFVSIGSDETHYWTQKGFTKLAARITQDPDPNFAEEYDAFKESAYGSPPQEVIVEPVKIDTEFRHHYSYHAEHQLYVKTNGKYCDASLYFNSYKNPPVYQLNYTIEDYLVINQKKCNVRLKRSSYYSYQRRKAEEITKAQLVNRDDFYRVSIKHKHGALTHI